MQPASIVEIHPERLPRQSAQVGDHGRGYLLDPFLMQRQRQMVMIDDVVFIARPPHHRDEVRAEKIGLLAGRMIAPTLALGFHLAHAHRHLRRPQCGNRYGMDPRFSGKGHGAGSDVCRRTRGLSERRLSLIHI